MARFVLHPPDDLSLSHRFSLEIITSEYFGHVERLTEEDLFDLWELLTKYFRNGEDQDGLRTED